MKHIEITGWKYMDVIVPSNWNLIQIIEYLNTIEPLIEALWAIENNSAYIWESDFENNIANLAGDNGNLTITITEVLTPLVF